MKRYLQKTVMVLLLLGGALFLGGCPSPVPVLEFVIFKFKDGMDYSGWARAGTTRYYSERYQDDFSTCGRVDYPIALDSSYYVAFWHALGGAYVNISIENWNNNIRPVAHLREVDSLIVLDNLDVYSECYFCDNLIESDTRREIHRHIKWKKLEPNSEGSIATYFDTTWFNGLVRDNKLSEFFFKRR